MEKPELLKVESLKVEVGGHKILKGVDLSIREGEIHVLFGPNGSGKTTLLGAIMGLPQYKILSGRIIFKGMDITDMPPNERAKLGIGLAFQKPPAVRGVRLGKLVELINRSGKSVDELAEMLNLNSHLLRDLNLGFSGGETKRSEMLQLLAQSPDFAMLDEPESGVDLENIGVIAAAFNHLLEKDKRIRERRKAALIITHTGYILDYVAADVGHIMIDGRIICSAPPYEILEAIKKYGYSECHKCFQEEVRSDG